MSTATSQSERSSLFLDLDRLLRQQSRGPDTADADAPPLTAKRLGRLVLILGGLYGASLGSYGVIHGHSGAWLQMLSATIKLPLLFALTLVVTLPSLYVFATLLRLPLGPKATLRALLGAVTVQLAVMASLGPVFAFFAASTESYPFLLLLNVAIAGAGGALSLVILKRAADSALASAPGGRRLLLTWSLIYGAVGAQMSWLLRPFLGKPDLEFSVLRPRESSFFEAVICSIGEWVTGG